MTPKTRHRSRSSVDHIFELVEHLEEDQLQDLLHELNSTGDNVQVSRGVEFFDERLRRPGSRNGGGGALKENKHPLRPTPSFLNQPHEPADWPRQKPRPVSGSQWRQSMRIVSSPYATTTAGAGGLARHQTEPISPPLTASPPSSPPMMSSPRSAVGGSPRRSVTAPLLKTRGAGGGDMSPRVEVVPAPDSPVSPPRNSEDEEEEDEHPRPSLSEFGAFSFGLPVAQTQTQTQTPPAPHERPASPRAAAATSTPPPLQKPDFSRISTMPLSTLHHEPLDAFCELLPRPSTSTGDPAAALQGHKPRAFRRISRPTFLSPAATAAPDDLAKKLSAYLFEDLAVPSSSSPTPAPAPRRKGQEETAEEQAASLEAMLREPLTPRSRFVFGRVEREVPSVSGIFQVLKEG